MILVLVTFSLSIVCLLLGVTTQTLFTNRIASVGGTRIDLRRRRRYGSDKAHNPMHAAISSPNNHVRGLVEIGTFVVLFGIRVANRRLIARHNRRMPGLPPREQ